MEQTSPKVIQPFSNMGSDETIGYMFYCPGCEEWHQFRLDRWTFNGNIECPTVSPSILVRMTLGDPPITAENWDEWKRNPWEQTKKEHICHSFIR